MIDVLALLMCLRLTNATSFASSAGFPSGKGFVFQFSFITILKVIRAPIIVATVGVPTIWSECHIYPTDKCTLVDSCCRLHNYFSSLRYRDLMLAMITHRLDLKLVENYFRSSQSVISLNFETPSQIFVLYFKGELHEHVIYH